MAPSLKSAPKKARQKTPSGLFLAAAKKLEKQHVSVICHAIEACKTYPVDMRTTAKEIVRERLGRSLFYSGWIHSNHPDLWNKAMKEGNAAVMARQGRIAWCRALAEEFKGKAS